MEKLQESTQELSWLSSELQREIETLANTPYHHVHAFLAKNILHAIEKQAVRIQQALTDESSQKERAS